MTRDTPRDGTDFTPLLKDAWVLIRLVRAMGIRKPYWRIFKREKPKCGARCRDGHPCQAPAAWDEYRCGIRNGRCRIHGGLSTGPRTKEGKRRISEAQKARWKAYRRAKQSGAC